MGSLSQDDLNVHFFQTAFMNLTSSHFMFFFFKLKNFKVWFFSQLWRFELSEVYPFSNSMLIYPTIINCIFVLLTSLSLPQANGHLTA